VVLLVKIGPSDHAEDSTGRQSNRITTSSSTTENYLSQQQVGMESRAQLWQQVLFLNKKKSTTLNFPPGWRGHKIATF